jgi:DNA alkylation repair enzyme
VDRTFSSSLDRLPTLAALRRELTRAANPERARNPIWFNTAKGDYGEGDEFIGVLVPTLRAIARSYGHLKLTEIEKLLASKIHEYRYAGLLILVSQYGAANQRVRQEVFDFYIAHTRYVNNWDLVDTTAPYIVGEHLIHRSRRVLYRLADSSVLWVTWHGHASPSLRSDAVCGWDNQAFTGVWSLTADSSE